MHPIQLLRKKDPTLRADLARRPKHIAWEEFDQLEEKRQMAQVKLENARARRRQIAEQVGQLKRQGQDAIALMAEGAELNETLDDLEMALAPLEDAQHQWVLGIPNSPHEQVPLGDGEDQNQEVQVVGSIPRAAHLGQDHIAIAQAFGGLDGEAAAQLSGSRFTLMKGDMAKLHRALIQMMLDLHEEAGFEEINVPYLVRGQTLQGTGQLPKFSEDLFKTQDDLYLIPTAEVPLTNLIANRVLTLDELPLAWCAHTPCFRREAGAAGRDVHGLIRQHQFEKVELVRVEHPNRSEEALVKDILGNAKRVMDALEVPYRVMELCTGDLGFSAHHTFDIEVWLPSQQKYREISSCSNMGDFQARRMNAKLKDGKQTLVPHTLNGSGLAVGRSLVAVLENHIQADGKLYLPGRLRPYLKGKPYLEPILK